MPSAERYWRRMRRAAPGTRALLAGLDAAGAQAVEEETVSPFSLPPPSSCPLLLPPPSFLPPSLRPPAPQNMRLKRQYIISTGGHSLLLAANRRCRRSQLCRWVAWLAADPGSQPPALGLFSPSPLRPAALTRADIDKNPRFPSHAARTP